MNLVDSSAWIEYFAEGPNAEYFAPVIENTAELVVPSISLFEVFKRILQQRSETDALRAVTVMMQGQIIDLDASLALSAARTSVNEKLAMADSIILMTARSMHATIWTQDADFKDIPDVQYKAR